MSNLDDGEFRVYLEDVDLQRGQRTIFQGLTCGFPRGGISVVLGGSGVGKSTLLRLIGGLVRPNAGRVFVAGQDITRQSESELFRTREYLGMLFQGGALLDSLTVFDNVALPLREHTHLSEADIAGEVGRRLEAVGLSDVDDLLPGKLSGGMSRRAALARAIVTDPEIVLVDEPFSGLDPVNLRRIENLLVDLNRRLGITLVVTSHHIASTARMADQVVFLVDAQALSGSLPELLEAGDPRLMKFMAAERDADTQVAAIAPESDA
ncbi:ATP-binding cassette domain-containing protein [Myxococcota bacterium]|nr:ATP-binding cassette domain-containing protein [Myxococcota bacterium]